MRSPDGCTTGTIYNVRRGAVRAQAIRTTLAKSGRISLATSGEVTRLRFSGSAHRHRRTEALRGDPKRSVELARGVLKGDERGQLHDRVVVEEAT